MSPTSLPSNWTRWIPTNSQPWNVRRVVHLHRRVGFAANWETIQRDLREGPDAAIGRLLKPEPKTDFAQTADVIGDAAVGADNPHRLKAWWLYRMLFTPDPLGERLTLMWHNHFATSNLKVKNLDLMRRQNSLFREFGRGPFGPLIQRIAKDPAILIWLDAEANRKEHPNENLAREIMELFTLGVGNYSETDVREAARTLTGWSVKEGRFRNYLQFHDDGNKTLFGKTGPWKGDDLVQMLIEHPAIATRLSHRLCELFMGEGVINDASVDQLASILRQNKLDIGHAVETIVRSDLFFSDRNIGNRVLSPAEFIVNLIRSLDLLTPPPSTLLLAEWSATLGEDLFYPPNVFGRPGGRAWLTTRSLIGRANFVTTLIEGSVFKPHRPLDAESLAKRYSYERHRVPEFFGQLIAGLDASSPLVAQQQARLQSTDPALVSDVVAAILTSPNAMLG